MLIYIFEDGFKVIFNKPDEEAVDKLIITHGSVKDIEVKAGI